MENRCDVIIVGAGLAGVSAGIEIAKGGKKVVILEKGAHAGGKNMFGGVIYTKPTLEIFPNLLEEAPIERLNLSHRWAILDEENSTTVDFRNNSADVNSFTTFRPRFDKWCCEQAKKQGVYFAPSTLVEKILVENGKVIGVQTQYEKYFADIVIIAEGVNSLLTESIGLKKPTEAKNVALSVKEVLKLPKEVINERFNVDGNHAVAYQIIGGPLSKMFGMGFLYLYKNSISIGLGVSLQDLKDKKLKPYDLLNELKKHKSIAPLIEGGELMEYQAHLIPEGGYKAIGKVYGAGVLVVGDSAGLVNNVHFEGTNLAMISGKMAGEVAVQALNENDFSEKSLSRYEKKLDESFIMKDLKSYQSVISGIDKNSEVFLGIYVKKISQFLEMFTTADGVPKKEKYRKFLTDFVKERSIWGLVKDFWGFLKMGIGVIK